MDSAGPMDAIEQVVSIGRAHSISSYDAAYLELAMREGLPFATADERLKKVAVQLGIDLL